MQEPVREKQVALSEYGNRIWRRKWLIVALCAVSVLTTLAVNLQLPKYYKSEAVILALAPETGGLGAALSSSPLGALAGSIGGISTPADRILVYLKSRTVAEMVIKRFDLVRIIHEDKWDAAKGSWKDAARPPLKEDTVKVLNKTITAFKKSKEGTITITVEWKDPKLAADMANYYIAALTEYLKDKSVNTTIQIIDTAIPAERKSRPIIRLNIALAGLISLFLGVFIAIALNNNSRQEPDQEP